MCGTGIQLAEQLADIYTSGDADGFVISPALLPDSFAEFVDAVVPHLQRMGVLRQHYESSTLRGNLQA
jgi:alkanesulfonate monooxygenase SsuD/methylene tetrahydromethanopterin reductase-like flavin-dependent oxidoreductase (luciferase family)